MQMEGEGRGETVANIERSDKKSELRSDDRTLLREQATPTRLASGKSSNYVSIFAQASNS